MCLSCTCLDAGVGFFECTCSQPRAHVCHVMLRIHMRLACLRDFLVGERLQLVAAVLSRDHGYMLHCMIVLMFMC